QSETVTTDQMSTLFWINILVGAVLTLLAASFAPVIAAFYHQPPLFWITIVLALSFFFNAMGVQHSALLQRDMRFTAMSVINVIAMVVGSALAIGMAKFGYGYWALVAMTVTQPLVTSIGMWIAAPWVPGPPRRKTGIRSMMRYGGTITLNGLVVYIAYNM